MMSTLETGYFIWNFSAWFKILLLSAGIFCLFIHVVKRRYGVTFVNSKKVSRCNEEIEEGLFVQKISSFRRKVMQPWFDFPFSHILSIIVLFLLFAVVLFSKSGVE